MATRRLSTVWAMLMTALPLLSLAGAPARITPSDPSPLATASELIERQFSPLEAFRLQEKVRSLGLKDAFHIDLAAERLLVRAPAKTPADGRYGLIVFLDSRKQTRFDFEWDNVLDSHGVIFVSPDNAGDDASALDRRIPLALDAVEYARRFYKLDPDRIYIAGVGGGSRIAERLAVSYPEVFTAAIMNSGAVEIGTQELPAPAQDSLTRLRTHSRLAFLSAFQDQPAFAEQRRALESLRKYCMPVAGVWENGHTIAGHPTIDGRLLSDILNIFEAPRGAKEQPQPGCEATFRGGALSALANIRQLDADGRRDEALKALVTFDHAYGRLFVDEEVALAKKLNPGFFAPTAPSGSSSPGSH
ncbi:MAG: hypothetical protein JWL98_2122 [Xanthomonadaceae bacterium]|nr:hypothetical protein [Xanthomonadaceae bacterium]